MKLLKGLLYTKQMNAGKAKGTDSILYPAISVTSPLLKEELAELLSSYCFSMGSTGIEESESGFTAYFNEGKDLSEIRELASLLTCVAWRFNPSIDLKTKVFTIEDYDWVSELKRRFKPFVVGNKIRIRPPWAEPSIDFIDVMIEPSRAFGTGEHPTTRLCLMELEALSGEGFNGSLLDVGTGSGILAMVGSLLGFSPVTAIDNDPTAVEIAKENIRKNNLKDITLILSEPDGISGSYDLIVANLTAGAISQCIDQLIRLGHDKTRWVFSGIMSDQQEPVLDLISGKNMKLLRKRDLADWLLITAMKQS